MLKFLLKMTPKNLAETNRGVAAKAWKQGVIWQADLAGGLDTRDHRFNDLIRLFHKYKKVLEQEIFIRKAL